MFKRFLMGFTLMAGLAVNSFAGKPLVADAPISGVGTAATISVSITVWTLVPTSQTDGRVGILVNNPSTNSAAMVGVLSADCDGSITTATTVRPLEFATSTDFTFIPVNDDVCLYLLSLNGSAENVHVQDVKQ